MNIFLPPLRVPTETPLAKELERWLLYVHTHNSPLDDQANNNQTAAQAALLPLLEECRRDLERLEDQRTKLRVLLRQGYPAMVAHKDIVWTYARLLQSFATHGFALVMRKEHQKIQHRKRRSDNNASFTFNDSMTSLEGFTKQAEEEDIASVPTVSFAWTTSESASMSTPEDCMLWEWEQANVQYTLALLEAYQGQELSVTAQRSPEWRRVMGHYTTAATWITYLQQEYFGATAISNQQPTQYLWSVGHTLSWEGLQIQRTLWHATAERVGIEVVSQPLIKAKISSAAAVKFEECRLLLDEPKQSDYWETWRTSVPLLARLCQALAQSHQATAHMSRQEYTLAFRRYRRAIDLGEECQAVLKKLPRHEEGLLPQFELTKLTDMLLEWQAKCAKIVEETPLAAEGEVDEASLPLIPPQKVTKIDLKLVHAQIEGASTKLSLDPPPFKHLLTPEMRSHVHSFQSQMETLLRTTIRRAEEKAESGRRALAIHNLPHALATYQRDMVSGNANGGLPEELWEKIHALQNTNKMNMLQQELWELKDMADMTQQTYQKIHTLLDEDLRVDQDFRKEHPQYGGHDVEGVQKRYRQALQNYQSLMETASNSDAQLLRRLEELPTDTKFKLLSKSKAQLDCLLPATAPKSHPEDVVDVTALSNALATLSDLFRERDELVQELTMAVRNFNLMDFIQDVIQGDPTEQTPAALQSIFQSAQESLQDMIQDIKGNMSRQTDLVKKALDENVKFVKARDEQERQQSASALNNARTNRTLVMIHQAIEEVEELSKYLEEGKAFYNVVLPKLQRVLAHVEEMSTRLTIGRCEYEDKERLSRQEAEDAQFAASMANGASDGPPDPPPTGSRHRGDLNASSEESPAVDLAAEIPNETDQQDTHATRNNNSPATNRIAEIHRRDSGSHLPGAETVSHESPDVRVDDAKVAHLIGMDFDPERVVEALKKYDNNLEQALNDLLSG